MSQTILPQPEAEWLLIRGVLARRFFAMLVDMLLLGIVSLGLAIFITLLGFLTLGVGFLAFGILNWLPMLYFTLLVGNGGATLGQMLFGLRVRQDENLATPSLAQGLVWSLLLWLSFALACVPFLLALTNPRHRAMHDLLSGLVVVRRPKSCIDGAR